MTGESTRHPHENARRQATDVLTGELEALGRLADGVGQQAWVGGQRAPAAGCLLDDGLGQGRLLAERAARSALWTVAPS